MSEFRSYRSFLDFQLDVRRKSRYVRNQETKDFLNTVATTAQKRIRTFEVGVTFWRAQLGHDWRPLIEDGENVADIECPYSPERMRPLQDRASEGRANPKGIPCLYLATDKKTAMAEVRPWVGSLISVAQFKTKKPLKLVDCSADLSSLRIYFEEPDAENREKSVWSDINVAFSKPVSPTDHTADYAPTQIIAELFKNEGFDGIAYRSALGNGHNVALFDLESADLINCHLFEVKELRFIFQKAANPYFIMSYYKKKAEEDA